MRLSLIHIWGFDRFSRVVREAQFDRLLLRPRSLIFQLICPEIEFARLGKLLQGALMLGYGVAASGIAWTPARVAVLAGMVLGGTAVFLSLIHI